MMIVEEAVLHRFQAIIEEVTALRDEQTKLESRMHLVKQALWGIVDEMEPGSHREAPMVQVVA